MLQRNLYRRAVFDRRSGIDYGQRFSRRGDVLPQSTPVRIERGAWIGARAIILKGVTIGEGAVVGAGAVVTHSVPPRSLAVGNPAQIVRQW
ncbi:MAG: hypothetical protein HY868_15890 [Chloroflexi bacterium]|nr:hypothetical protein [Chloroflexota bacterium]